jgi:cobalt-zinc-cadmium efflux system membrane fusion protein
MRLLQSKSSRVVGYVLIGLVILIGLTGAATFVLRGSFDVYAANKPTSRADTAQTGPTSTVELVAGAPHTVFVPEQVRRALRIGDSVPAQPATQKRPLILPGSTALDPTCIMRVRTRFNAEVREIGQISEVGTSERTVMRELRPGDTVQKGDVLAVVWSTDVGSRKSDLLEALVQLWLDEERLKNRIELWKAGNLPEDTLNQTRRDVVTDRSGVDRAERTLRTWNIPEREIQAVREEAEEAFRRQGKRDKEKEKLWARSELIAPRDGTIVERNVGVGEYVADNTINLFTIADVRTMVVIANPPEDYLPTLLSLKPEERRWSLSTVGAGSLTGRIDEIGYILDANQHTAVVKGHIDNPEGRLRAGQFVSAKVELAPPPDVVEVPLTALAEDGKQSFVFVQPDLTQPHYTMRRVQVTLRFEKTAFVRSKLQPEEERLTPEETALGLQARQPLRPGERYLTSGVLELRAALEDRESKAKKSH